MSDVGDGWWDELKQKAADAAQNPEPGMGFHEMYSVWVFVVAVTATEVHVVGGSGHPSWFPECGTPRAISRDEFPAFVQYALLSERRYDVAGWSGRAEGISIEELESRVRATGRRTKHVA